MKRKIAILLSAMMVTSAMPLTAQASIIEGDTVLNPGFSKTNKPIDVYADRYENIKTIDESTESLKARQAVYRMNLKDNLTEAIPKGSNFEVRLDDNGSFEDERTFEKNKSQFTYRNITVGRKFLDNYRPTSEEENTTTRANMVTLDEMYGPAGKNSYTSVKSLQEVWMRTANAKAPARQAITNASSGTAVLSDLTGNDQYIFGTVQNVLDGDNSSGSNLDTEIKAVLSAVNALSGRGIVSKTVKEDGSSNSINEQTAVETALNNFIQKAMIGQTGAVNIQPSGGNVDISIKMEGGFQKAIPFDVQRVDERTLRYETIVDLRDEDKNLNLKDFKVAAEQSSSINALPKVNVDFDVYYYVNEATESGDINFKMVTDKDLERNSNILEEVVGFRLIPKMDSSFLAERGGDNTVKVNDPYMLLPFGGVTSIDEALPIKANLTSELNNKIPSKEFTLTKNDGEKEGSTKFVYDATNVRAFEDYTRLAPVVIRENVRRTIGTVESNKNEATIIYRLNGGFKFKNIDKIKTLEDNSESNFETNKIRVIDEANRDGDVKYYFNIEDVEMLGDGSFKLKITDLKEAGNYESGNNRQRPLSIAIEGLEIEPVNSNVQGDADLTVSGDGITTETKTVAKRSNYKFSLKTLKDPKDIISGRYYSKNNRTMIEEQNKTVKIKFAEEIPNALVVQRALDFQVPEGVKIVSANIEDTKNIYNDDKNKKFDYTKSFEIRDNGRTLRLVRDTYTKVDNKNNTALVNFIMELNLSVDAGFEGDITLTVNGGGQDEKDKASAVIAKAKKPFTLQATSTKVNLGYQDTPTSDISITEIKPGMFLQGFDAILGIKAPFGTQELGFSSGSVATDSKELVIKQLTEKGKISFRVDRESYKEPATVKVTNVKVGTTRSIPYGSYALTLGGKAIINNDGEVKEPNIVISDVREIRTQNTKEANDRLNVINHDNDHYELANYFELVTETGTFDKIVKVTIGEKTVQIDDKTVQMDVAPYIQASSNSTLVPLRFVSLALGVDSIENADASQKIVFDNNAKVATIYYGSGTGQKIIQFQAGSNYMTVDGTKIPMEFGVKAEIKDNRMFVPFRAIGQALGIAVDWDANTRTAIFNSDKQIKSVAVTETTTEASSETTTTSGSESTTSSDSTTTSDSSTTTTTAAK